MSVRRDCATAVHFKLGNFTMDITIITAAIDKEIATRTSDKFGIKMGGKLYTALAKTGKISLATFSAFGTGAYLQEVPANDGKYFVYTCLTPKPEDFDLR